MEPIVLIGRLELDALHLVAFGAAMIAAAAVFWLRNRADRALSEVERARDWEAKERARLAEEAGFAREEVKTQRLRAEDAERRLAGLSALSAEMDKKFGDLAQGVLRQANAQFLELANETFEKHKAGAKSDLEQLMQPIGQSFSEFKQRVEAIEKVRLEERTALQEQVRAIGDSLQQNTHATSKLVTALSAPRGGGSWGEESLRNVMELAGMSAHADFAEQTSQDAEGGRMRPDVIIRMPGGREIVVDSKVSMEDFLKAAEEPDDRTRRQHLAAHARKIRDHVQRLAKKEYWKPFEDRVDFVAMYVPGEQFYAAALEIDRDLFDYAARNKVIIVTPSTLIALAKAVAYGWRQEEAAANARAATELGRQLYDRLSAMGGHIDKLGRSLNASVDSFNKMNRSLETRVLPSARRFETLSIAPPDKSLPEIEAIETRAGGPARTGELALEPADDEAA